jgi:hypothetical protein
MYGCSPADVCCWRHQILCMANLAVCPGPDSIPKFSRRYCAQQERSRPKNVARRLGRYQPLSAAWQREVPPCKPEAPGGTSHLSARSDPRSSPDLHRPHRPMRFGGFARDGATAPGAPPRPADRFDRTTPDRADTAQSYRHRTFGLRVCKFGDRTCQALKLAALRGRSRP